MKVSRLIDLDYAYYLTIGRSQDELLSRRPNPHRISEERGDPYRYRQPDPGG
jgi:hypothetical protein